MSARQMAVLYLIRKACPACGTPMRLIRDETTNGEHDVCTRCDGDPLHDPTAQVDRQSAETTKPIVDALAELQTEIGPGNQEAAEAVSSVIHPGLCPSTRNAGFRSGGATLRANSMFAVARSKGGPKFNPGRCCGFALIQLKFAWVRSMPCLVRGCSQSFPSGDH